MCTNPLKAFKYGKTENGKDNYIIRKYDVDHLEILDDGRIINVYSAPIMASKRTIREFIEIPCNSCLQCRLDYSKRWADRCMLEAMYHDENAFITLTYDDKNVPLVDGVDPVTGELKKFKTLRKKHFQDFMKRFRNIVNEIPKEKRKFYNGRKYYRKGDDKFKEIRYMASGEYGSQTNRSHYHAIIFGWYPSDDDIVLLGKNELGQDYYGSATLAKAWPYGFHVIGKADWNSCAYVARYVVKKMFPFEKNFYEACNIEPEFILMSRRPGIGAQWYEDHKEEYYNFSKTYLKTQNGSHSIGSVKYFDRKVAKECPELYEDMIKNRVWFAKHRKALEKKQTNLKYIDYLSVKNENLERKTKALKVNKL